MHTCKLCKQGNHPLGNKLLWRLHPLSFFPSISLSIYLSIYPFLPRTRAYFSCPFSPFYRSSVASFSIHDARKGKRRSRRRRKNYFYGYKFVFAIFFLQDWKANTDESFEIWIGSRPASIWERTALCLSSSRQKSYFLWKEISLEFSSSERYHLLIPSPPTSCLIVSRDSH